MDGLAPPDLELLLTFSNLGNLRAVQLLLGHTKIESTVRYLGIEVDDALAGTSRFLKYGRADMLCPPSNRGLVPRTEKAVGLI